MHILIIHKSTANIQSFPDNTPSFRKKSYKKADSARKFQQSIRVLLIPYIYSSANAS